MTLSPDQAELAKVFELPTGNNQETPGFILLANDTLKNLKDGIAAINDHFILHMYITLAQDIFEFFSILL